MFDEDKRVASFLHDIVNKLLVCNEQLNKVRANGDEENLHKAIMTNKRAIELVRDLREHLTKIAENNAEPLNTEIMSMEVRDFVNNVSQRAITNAAEMYGLHLEINNKFLSENRSINVNTHKLQRIVENIFENARNAKATNIHINHIMEEYFFIVEVIDNGIGISDGIKQELITFKKNGPLGEHGIGTNFLKECLREVNAAISYERVSAEGGTLIRMAIPYA